MTFFENNALVVAVQPYSITNLRFELPDGKVTDVIFPIAMDFALHICNIYL